MGIAAEVPPGVFVGELVGEAAVDEEVVGDDVEVSLVFA
jgi:hypothetical protein